MALDERVVERARKYDRAAMESLLGEVYPVVHRMAAGLTGRADGARGVEQQVMRQALTQLHLWRAPDAVERWFYHHTILTARRATKHPVEPKEDLLAANAENPDAPYLAFLSALRRLPFQQREAFILKHGEKFNSRYLGVAMDCSTVAAETHLSAAEESLRALSGEALPGLIAKMGAAYSKLAPQEDLAIPNVKKYVRRTVWPRRFKRFFKTVLALALLGAAGYYGPRYWHRIPWDRVNEMIPWEKVPWINPTSRPTTQPTTAPSTQAAE